VGASRRQGSINPELGQPLEKCVALRQERCPAGGQIRLLRARGGGRFGVELVDLRLQRGDLVLQLSGCRQQAVRFLALAQVQVGRGVRIRHIRGAVRSGGRSLDRDDKSLTDTARADFAGGTDSGNDRGLHRRTLDDLDLGVDTDLRVGLGRC
jgi:hypothetical protein